MSDANDYCSLSITCAECSEEVDLKLDADAHLLKTMNTTLVSGKCCNHHLWYACKCCLETPCASLVKFNKRHGIISQTWKRVSQHAKGKTHEASLELWMARNALTKSRETQVEEEALVDNVALMDSDIDDMPTFFPDDDDDEDVDFNTQSTTAQPDDAAVANDGTRSIASPSSHQEEDWIYAFVSKDVGKPVNSIDDI